MPKIVSDLRQNAIHDIYTISRKDFPALLREISDPPSRLFVRGKFSSEMFDLIVDNTNKIENLPKSPPKFLCVVGSRRASSYGADACRTLITELGRTTAGRNIIIVSGLALGIDGIAHEVALKAGLRTVAVLGSGLDWDSIYPRGHVGLAKEIVASGGALISEFGEGYHPRKYNFPERNRIMAGLSHATLVVEASEKSGTLITARLALESNRDIFAVPGSIFSEQSAGANKLIADGAMLVQNATDILYGLGLKNETDQVNSSTVQNALYIEDLPVAEQQVYRALSTPLSRAELLTKLSSEKSLSTSTVIAAISTLEMRGLIVESGDKLRKKL